MYIKSENQKYIVSYKYVDEDNIYAKIFFWNINNICEKKSIYAKSGIGGERIAISNNGKYLVTGLYEKKVFIYDLENEADNNYKVIKTKKYIDNIEIINGKIYVIYLNGNIDVFSFDGLFIETQSNIEVITKDVCGEQCMVEDTYIRIADKKIKPVKISMFNNAIFLDDKIILSEIYGRVVCYSMSGNITWEYIANEVCERIGKIFYAQCVNSLVVEIYYPKQSNKNEKFYLFDIENGKFIMEKEIIDRDFVICNNNSILVDNNNVISLEELFKI